MGAKIKQKPMEATDNDQLIAEFMGAVVIERYPNHVLMDFIHKENYVGNSRYHASNTMKYQSSSEWLMPVVDKICKLPEFNRIMVNVVQSKVGTLCRIQTNVPYLDDPSFYNEEIVRTERMDAVYESVVKFIKWYNENK